MIDSTEGISSMFSDAARNASWDEFLNDLVEFTSLLSKDYIINTDDAGDTGNNMDGAGNAEEDDENSGGDIDYVAWSLSHALNTLLTTRRKHPQAYLLDSSIAIDNDDIDDYEEEDGDEDSAVVSILAAISKHEASKKESKTKDENHSFNDQSEKVCASNTNVDHNSSTGLVSGNAESMVVARAQTLINSSKSPNSTNMKECCDCLSSLPWSSPTLETERKLLKANNVLLEFGYNHSWPGMKQGLKISSKEVENADNIDQSDVYCPLRRNGLIGLHNPPIKIIQSILKEKPELYQHETRVRSTMPSFGNTDSTNSTMSGVGGFGSSILSLAACLSASQNELMYINLLISDTALQFGDLNTAIDYCISVFESNRKDNMGNIIKSNNNIQDEIFLVDGVSISLLNKLRSVIRSVCGLDSTLISELKEDVDLAEKQRILIEVALRNELLFVKMKHDDSVEAVHIDDNDINKSDDCKVLIGHLMLRWCVLDLSCRRPKPQTDIEVGDDDMFYRSSENKHTSRNFEENEMDSSAVDVSVTISKFLVPLSQVFNNECDNDTIFNQLQRLGFDEIYNRALKLISNLLDDCEDSTDGFDTNIDTETLKSEIELLECASRYVSLLQYETMIQQPNYLHHDSLLEHKDDIQCALCLRYLRNAILFEREVDCEETETMTDIMFEHEFLNSALSNLLALSNPRRSKHVINTALKFAKQYDSNSYKQERFRAEQEDNDWDDGNGDGKGDAHSRNKSTGKQKEDILFDENDFCKPDPNLVSQLVQMGFETAGARRTAIMTSNAPLEEALRWAINHGNDSNFNHPVVARLSSNSVQSSTTSSFPVLVSNNNNVDLKHLADAKIELEKEHNVMTNLIVLFALRYYSTLAFNISQDFLVTDSVDSPLSLPFIPLVSKAVKGLLITNLNSEESLHKEIYSMCFDEIGMLLQLSSSFDTKHSQISSLYKLYFGTSMEKNDLNDTSSPLRSIIHHNNNATLVTPHLKENIMGVSSLVLSPEEIEIQRLIQKWNDSDLDCNNMFSVKTICNCAKKAAMVPDRTCLVDALVLASFARTKLMVSSSDENEQLLHQIEAQSEFESKLGRDSFNQSISNGEFDWLNRNDNILAFCLDQWRLVALHIDAYMSDKHIESKIKSSNKSEVSIVADIATVMRKNSKKAVVNPSKDDGAEAASVIQVATTQEIKEEVFNDIVKYPLLNSARDRTNTLMDLLLHSTACDDINDDVKKYQALEADLNSLLRCMGLFRLLWVTCDGNRLAKLELICRLLADVALKADLCITNKLLATYDTGSAPTVGHDGGPSENELSFGVLRNQLKQFALLLRRLLTLNDFNGLDGHINFKLIMDCGIIEGDRNETIKAASEELSQSATFWVFKLIFASSNEYHRYQSAIACITHELRPIRSLLIRHDGNEEMEISEVTDRSSDWLGSSQVVTSIQSSLSKLARFCHNFNKSTTSSSPPNQSMIYRIFLEYSLAQAGSDSELHMKTKIADDSNDMGNNLFLFVYSCF